MRVWLFYGRTLFYCYRCIFCSISISILYIQALLFRMFSPLFIGLDFGTSGARAAVINADQEVLCQLQVSYSDRSVTSWPQCWQTALFELLSQIPLDLRKQAQSIAIDGTSATVLLSDRSGQPITEPLLYNDARGRSVLPQLTAIAPPASPVLSATSSLVKLLWWQSALPPEIWQQALVLMHQADWLGFLLHGQLGISDYHNALKLGYDVGQLTYPDWLLSLSIAHLLPQVKAPGSAIAPVQPAISDRFGFPPDCQVCGGTTDSIAAFLASGAGEPGDAVTSLGSTLVLKLLSRVRVDNDAHGIYSHRLGDLWLVGGASNTGGAVLQQFFSNQQIETLSQQIDPEHPSQLDYYPLSQPGERFPVNDPEKAPRLSPRPPADWRFLQGLLEGIARIEQQGYALLESLGADPVQRIFTAGGGARNPTWTAIRQHYLQRPVAIAQFPEAAVGAARLAAQTRASTS